MDVRFSPFADSGLRGAGIDCGTGQWEYVEVREAGEHQDGSTMDAWKSERSRARAGFWPSGSKSSSPPLQDRRLSLPEYPSYALRLRLCVPALVVTIAVIQLFL